MNLKERFISLLSPYNLLDIKVNSLWDELENAYSQSFRKYHNLDHLSELLSYFDMYVKELDRPDEVLWSIFYHDYIYNIWKKDNELKSAEKAARVLDSIHYPYDGVKRISALINSTSHHDSKTKDEAYMVDFDLAILGQSAEKYEEYARKIREEYGMVPILLYRKGRKRVLKRFLEKVQIYQTEIFISQYEEQAKINLNRELNTL